MDILATIQADSTQINADDLAQPITVTVTGVSAGTPDQPVNIMLAEFPDRAYRPCKSMRRVLVAAWGTDASQYIGRRMTLFNDPTVKWGGVAVGGVRISAMSNIDKRLSLALTTTRGKRSPFVVEPLADMPDDIADFDAAIAHAQTIDDLDGIAKELKAKGGQLGAHRTYLQQAWKSRREVLEAQQPAEQPVDRSDELVELELDAQ